MKAENYLPGLIIIETEDDDTAGQLCLFSSYEDRTTEALDALTALLRPKLAEAMAELKQLILRYHEAISDCPEAEGSVLIKIKDAVKALLDAAKGEK